MIDRYFRVEVISQTPNPQQLIWLSAHQCVCEGAAIDDDTPSEEKAGEYIVKHLLAGGRGHWSPFEAPQISFNVIGFPHSVMQQITRHRVGLHFSVQSQRYTGQRIVDAAVGMRDIEEVFYLRPVGTYSDRQSKKYEYTQVHRDRHLQKCKTAAMDYAEDVSTFGLSEEHARGLIPFDVRQNWVMSANVRSLCHVLDLRWKADAQLEAQQLCELIFPHFKNWCPAIAGYYEKHHMHKARLAP